MSALRDLQNSFRQHLISGDENILADVVSTRELSNKDRLAIYGNAYYARLIEVLADDFEAIHTLLGDEEFTRLCRGYINSYPSRFYSLRWFGQYMEDYIRTTEPYSRHEYLHEMARFEWLFTDAFDAEDGELITEADVARVPAESWPLLRVKLHPSVFWFEYRWNILPVWAAVKDEKNISALEKLEFPETCLIWRQKLTTKYRTLEPEEALLIRAVANNKNFSEWCELLVNEGKPVEQVPMFVAGIVKSWINQGMISEVQY